MKRQTLSGDISLKDIDAVVVGLKELRQKMPFLVALTALERRQNPHVRLNNLGAAEDCLMAAREHPSILPGHFDLAQFEQDVKVTVALYKCLTAIKDLGSDVQDTLAAVSVNTLKGTRQIRAQVKIAAVNTPGLKQLAQRFSSGSSRPVGAETTASETTGAVVSPIAAPAVTAAPAPAPSQPSPPAASAPETKAA